MIRRPPSPPLFPYPPLFRCGVALVEPRRRRGKPSGGLPGQIRGLARRTAGGRHLLQVVSHTAQLACCLSLRSEEHTSELQSPCNLVCRLLLEKKRHT